MQGPDAESGGWLGSLACECVSLSPHCKPGAEEAFALYVTQRKWDGLLGPYAGSEEVVGRSPSQQSLPLLPSSPVTDVWLAPRCSQYNVYTVLVATWIWP